MSDGGGAKYGAGGASSGSSVRDRERSGGGASNIRGGGSLLGGVAGAAAAAVGAAAAGAGGGGGGGAAISIATMCVVSCGVGNAIRSDMEIKRKIPMNTTACAADENSVVGTLERALSGRSSWPAASLNIGPTAAFS